MSGPISSTRTRQIEPDVLNVLAAADCHDNKLRLTSGQLERKLYVRTNEVLEALGGKWNRTAKAHLFEGSAADLVEEAILTGTFSKTKQDFGAFFTPLPLAVRLVERAQIRTGMDVLEPSAGQGILARIAEQEGGRVTAIEIQRELVLAWKIAQMGVGIGDFLTWDFEGKRYDRVVMNPPFARRADIAHIRRAHSLLKPAGQLVSIASAAVEFRDDVIGRGFRDWVAAHRGTIERLPDGSFRESGTIINTVMITMEAA